MVRALISRFRRERAGAEGPSGSTEPGRIEDAEAILVASMFTTYTLTTTHTVSNILCGSRVLNLLYQISNGAIGREVPLGSDGEVWFLRS
jgi:hypothetical protein